MATPLQQIPKRQLQPSASCCFVCGVNNPFGLHLRFYDIGPGEVQVDCTIPAHFEGYPGVVHGGVVAAMLDEAAGRSQMSAANTRFMFTARLQVKYRKNVPPGSLLHLVGRAGHSKGRIAEATSFLYDDEGNLLAEAEALLVDLPETSLSSEDLEKLGWKVYPEGTEG